MIVTIVGAAVIIFLMLVFFSLLSDAVGILREPVPRNCLPIELRRVKMMNKAKKKIIRSPDRLADRAGSPLACLVVFVFVPISL